MQRGAVTKLDFALGKFFQELGISFASFHCRRGSIADQDIAATQTDQILGDISDGRTPALGLRCRSLDLEPNIIT